MLNNATLFNGNNDEVMVRSFPTSCRAFLVTGDKCPPQCFQNSFGNETTTRLGLFFILTDVEDFGFVGGGRLP